MPSQASSKIPCHISEKVESDEIESIRKSVCCDLETLEHTDGKHYCILHIPSKEKDTKEFNQMIESRCRSVEEEIAEIKTVPDNQQDVIKKEVSYDFRYVYFPHEINFQDYKFLAKADFSSAIFTEDVGFWSTIFSGYASFSLSVFLGDANFIGAVFKADAAFCDSNFCRKAYFEEAHFTGYTLLNAVFIGEASFLSAEFEGDVDFCEATFLQSADFGSAIFKKLVGFEDAFFFKAVHFYKSEFLETSQIIFKRTQLCAEISFNQAVFEGFIRFEGDDNEKVFLNSESISEIREHLRERLRELKQALSEREIEYQDLRRFLDTAESYLLNSKRPEWKSGKETYEEFLKKLGNQDATLDLQNARLKRPERISFHTVRLRPNWFVNTDPRKMVFTNIDWENTEDFETSKSGIESEIFQLLKKRKIQGPEKPFINALNALAENAEAGRRFEEAKKFQKMAITLEGKKCHVHDSLKESQKDLLRKKTCQELPIINEHEGKYYCLLHLPTKDKNSTKFEEIFLARLKAIESKIASIAILPDEEKKKAMAKATYDFRFLWFPNGLNLDGYKFRTQVNFQSSVFFDSVSFMNCEFEQRASFNNCVFQNDTLFNKSTFHGEASFYNSKFMPDSWANFKGAKFKDKIDFKYATFKGNVKFSSTEQNKIFDGENTRLSIETEFIESGKVSFHLVSLRPWWFINCDARKLSFTDINWGKDFGSLDYLKKEIAQAEKSGIKDRTEHLMGIACRQLAGNAEENNRYEEASKFRKMAVEAERLQRIGRRPEWKMELSAIFSKQSTCTSVFADLKSRAIETAKHLRKTPYSPVSFLYRWTSGYGESWGWATFVLLLLVIGFGLLFGSSLSRFENIQKEKDAKEHSSENRREDEKFRYMPTGEGIVHSLFVAALQRPEPKAYDTQTKFFVIMATILGPLQAALLALAIRRKFMR